MQQVGDSKLSAEKAHDSPIAGPQPWQVKLLQRATWTLAALTLTWGVFFLNSQGVRQTRWILVGIITLFAVPALPLFGYKTRTWLFILAFLYSSFISAHVGGPTPGSYLACIVAVLSAGLLLGMREAIGVWICTIAALGVIWIGGFIADDFSVDLLDPRVDGNGPRMVGTYIAYSSIIALVVSAIVKQLSQTAVDAKAATLHAQHLCAQAERARDERSHALDQLIEAQKFEIAAQLSGAVAHDVNNSLQILLVHAELLRKDALSPAEVREIGDEMREVCQDVAGLARQLLTLGKRVLLERKVVYLGSELETICVAIRKVIPTTIELDVVIACNPVVDIDVVQIRQSLLNLAINAVQAMPSGGRMTIALHPSSDGRAELMVRDTGVGMDESMIAKVLEPYFTTKGNQGTGLGLATVKAVVEQHHGEIRLESQVGKGTTLRLYLPTTDRQVETRDSIEPDSEELNNLTILVVDDDRRVLQAIERMLRERGAKVLSARDVEQALALCTTTIDVLCTDAVMPGRPVRDLLHHFEQLYPHSGIIICSALVQSELVRQGIQEGTYGHLAKPFSASALARKVIEACPAETDHQPR